MKVWIQFVRAGSEGMEREFVRVVVEHKDPGLSRGTILAQFRADLPRQIKLNRSSLEIGSGTPAQIVQFILRMNLNSFIKHGFDPESLKKLSGR